MKVQFTCPKCGSHRTYVTYSDKHTVTALTLDEDGLHTWHNIRIETQHKDLECASCENFEFRVDDVLLPAMFTSGVLKEVTE
jgi:Zn finger protein HypA/HybF involved in hydrogenase expression